MSKINVDASLYCFPEKAHENDAAYDLKVGTEVEVSPNKRFYVPLGFRIQLPANMKLLIQPRSGMSGKGMVIHVWYPNWMRLGYLGNVRENLDVILGLIDSDYGEEVHAIVKSGRWKWKNRILRALGFRFFIHVGDRICQGAFTYVPSINLVDGPVNGTREGLGSTDKDIKAI